MPLAPLGDPFGLTPENVNSSPSPEQPPKPVSCFFILIAFQLDGMEIKLTREKTTKSFRQRFLIGYYQMLSETPNARLAKIRFGKKVVDREFIGKQLVDRE
ncbi:unnamed protein product [Nippostrongylus brasiliensis]|uniref:Ubiquitin-like domain-containing protein n=1 Tax=Nippostrongylus brasiliensis TaxID=27835 RepID=A0A0N4XZT9_NIPBR|nr:unnamed protein product [Nippostrongylus brasiliensis]